MIASTAPASLPDERRLHNDDRRPAAVTIAGASVAGLVLAAALRREGFAGRVTVLSEPLRERRRLVAGCSLRRATLAHFAAAFGTTFEDAARAIAAPAAEFRRLVVTTGRARLKGHIRFGPPLLDAAEPHPIGLSTRHDRILRGLRVLARPLGIDLVDRRIEVPTDLADLAPPGTLLVNATPRRGLLADAPAPRPLRRFVIAAQAPCVPARVGQGTPPSPLAPATAFAPYIAFPDGVHLAFFTPFEDDLSPAATWYGIDTRIVAAPASGAPPDPAPVVRGLERLAAAVGLELLDASETLGAAAVPIDEVPFDAAAPSVDPLGPPPAIGAARLLSPGAPAINVDGMLAAAQGARALAAAIARGEPRPAAGAAVAAALAPLRARNRRMQLSMALPPALLRLLLGPLGRAAGPAILRDWVAPPGAPPGA